jgi:hypothetical protein
MVRVRGKRWNGFRKRQVLVIAVVASLALAGTAASIGTYLLTRHERVDLLAQQELFHARNPDDPKRLGPFVQITSGDNWALIAWRSRVGICLDFAIPGTSPFDCDFPVRGAKPATSASGSGPPTHSIAGFVCSGNLRGGDGKAAIFGVASREVASVKIALSNGDAVDAPLYRARPV